jgi:hypothetical protein
MSRTGRQFSIASIAVALLLACFPVAVLGSASAAGSDGPTIAVPAVPAVPAVARDWSVAPSAATALSRAAKVPFGPATVAWTAGSDRETATGVEQVVGGSGDATLVWETFRRPFDRIVAVQSTPSGWSKPINVAACRGVDCYSRRTTLIAPDGDVTIVWLEGGSGGTTGSADRSAVRSRTISHGELESAVTFGDPAHSELVWTAVDGAGNVVVLWVTAKGYLAGAVRPAGGPWAAPTVLARQLWDTTSLLPGSDAVRLLPGAGPMPTHVVWGTETQVVFDALTPSGWAEPVAIATGTRLSGPVASSAADGTAIIAWLDSVKDGRLQGSATIYTNGVWGPPQQFVDEDWNGDGWEVHTSISDVLMGFGSDPVVTYTYPVPKSYQAGGAQLIGETWIPFEGDATEATGSGIVARHWGYDYYGSNLDQVTYKQMTAARLVLGILQPSQVIARRFTQESSYVTADGTLLVATACSRSICPKPYGVWLTRLVRGAWTKPQTVSTSYSSGLSVRGDASGRISMVWQTGRRIIAVRSLA